MSATVPWEPFVTERTDLGDITMETIYEPRGRVTKEMLFDDALQVVAKAYGWSSEEDIEKIRSTYTFDSFLVADLICLTRNDTRVCGLCTFRFFEHDGEPIMHVSSSAMSPEFQGRDAMTRMVRAGLAQARNRLSNNPPPRHWLTLITQNPVAYGGFSFRGDMYPSMIDAPPPEDARKIGRFIHQEFAPNAAFEEDKFILRNECQLFHREIPRWKEPHVNTWFDKNLRYEQGDTIIMIRKTSSLM